MMFFGKKHASTTAPVALQLQLDTAVKQLEDIKQILFPAFETTTTDEGQIIQIDYSADSNLEAALSDIEDGYSDETVQKTIKNVIDRVYKIRKLMNVWQEIKAETQGIVIAAQPSEPIDDSILARDERIQYANSDNKNSISTVC